MNPPAVAATVPLAPTPLERALRPGAVSAVFQPIVDLTTGAVVGYEALARGPRETPYKRPDVLLDAARAEGKLSEADWTCRAAAWPGALEAPLHPPATLFLNAEPETLAEPCPPHHRELWARAGEELRVIVEVTERALTARPAELLHGVARLRRLGWGVALDDVGVDPRSLAIMPFLCPDVIKLDFRLTHRRPTPHAAQIVAAVNAQVERTGATLLAEGIETEEHLATALALGATLGQGYLFGRPGPLASPDSTPTPWPPVPVTTPASIDSELTPFVLISRSRPVHRSAKELLVTISRNIEDQAAALGNAAVILTAFQDRRHISPITARRYTALSEGAAFVAAIGDDMGAEPMAGVRGATLSPGDPLRQEWNVVAIGPHFAAAFAARDLGDEGPDRERRFDYTITYDRELAVQAARLMMNKVAPLAA